MIAVISGTNRENSRTSIVASLYAELLSKNTSEEISVIDLREMNGKVISADDYLPGLESDFIKAAQEKLIEANKWVIVAPEYNGTYPGILKYFIDLLSINTRGETFVDKYLSIVGISTGRGGNIRGLDHLTTSLQYMKMHVYHNRYPISLAMNFIENGRLISSAEADLEKHAMNFLAWSV